jgi:hypothetical protein
MIVSRMTVPIALLSPGPRFSPETSNATHGLVARQEPLRSIDRIASRFDLVVQL